MLQLQRYSPPPRQQAQPLKANHSQRNGSEQIHLKDIESLIKQYTDMIVNTDRSFYGVTVESLTEALSNIPRLRSLLLGTDTNMTDEKIKFFLEELKDFEDQFNKMLNYKRLIEAINPRKPIEQLKP